MRRGDWGDWVGGGPPRQASASHAIGQSRRPVALHGVGWTGQATNNERTTGARRGADPAMRVRPTPSANPADLSLSMAWDGRVNQRTTGARRGADLAARVRPTPSANPADLSRSMAWDGRVKQRIINGERALVVGRGPPQAKAVGLQRRRPLKRAGVAANRAHDQPHS